MQVRSMKAEDIYNIIASNELKNLNDKKYQKLFANSAYYWVAGDNLLFQVTGTGDVYSARTYVANGIRPIVSLRSSVQANNKDMTGAWNIEI